MSLWQVILHDFGRPFSLDWKVSRPIIYTRQASFELFCLLAFSFAWILTFFYFVFVPVDGGFSYGAFAILIFGPVAFFLGCIVIKFLISRYVVSLIETSEVCTSNASGRRPPQSVIDVLSMMASVDFRKWDNVSYRSFVLFVPTLRPLTVFDLAHAIAVHSGRDPTDQMLDIVSDIVSDSEYPPSNFESLFHLIERHLVDVKEASG